jgi:hypothetical protein
MSTSLGPLDVTSIIARLRDQVPALKLVAGAADRATAMQGAIALPAAFVILAGEDNSSEAITGALRKITVAQIDIVVGMRHSAPAKRGQAQADDANPIVSAIRTALHGWTPVGPAGARTESIRCHGKSRLLALANAEWWWVDQFQCTYRGRT